MHYRLLAAHVDTYALDFISLKRQVYAQQCEKPINLEDSYVLGLECHFKINVHHGVHHSQG